MEEWNEESQAKWIRFRELLVDYALYGNGEEVVMLRRGAPRALVEAVNAGLLAHAYGIKSLNKVKELYPDLVASPPSRDKDVDAFHEVFRASLDYIDEALSRFVRDESRRPSLGVRLSDIALRRLRGSFVRAGFLYSIGGFFEGNAISRQILEQLAWAYSVSKIDDWESARKISPTKSITALGRLIPGIGKFYGSLRPLVHLTTESQSLVVREVKNKLKIVEAYGEESLLQVFNLVVLADIFAVVFE